MIAALILLALVAGSLVYCALTVIAAVRYKRVRPPELHSAPPISILKPLSGAEDGLEENLASFFEQQYPRFEILFAVREASDPAVAVVEKVRARFPGVPSRILTTGEPPYPNVKVFKLDRMLEAAQYDLLVMADSDVRFAPGALQRLAAEFEDPAVGLSTCPYRAVPGKGLWSLLEAIGLNTQFLGGVLVARMLEGMKFAVGPTITARRAAILEIGGWEALHEYLAEDFVLGKRVAESGRQVILSSCVIEHHIGGQPFVPNFKHRLRWRRSTRRSRPWGYVGELFTNPLPPALALCLLKPEWWPVGAVTAALRALSGWATAGYVLRDPLTARFWALTPLQDFADFAVWVCGFFGKTILWRGRKYHLLPDGRFRLIEP